MGIGKSDAPPPPDYAAAARATSQGNLEATRAATQANRINQYTPYGSLEFTQKPSGQYDYDAYNQALTAYNSAQAGGGGQGQQSAVGSGGYMGLLGNLLGGGSASGGGGAGGVAPKLENFMKYNPDSGWEQRINLTPEGQALLDQQNKTSQNLANLQDTASDRVRAQQAAGWGDDKLVQSPFNPGETAQDAIMRRMQPMLDRSRNSAETRLANMGIQQGSEAWKNAQSDIGMQENDAYSQAALQGISTGQQARQQGIQEQQYFNTRDLNALNALRTGSQVTNPTFGGYAQQATTAGPDMLGAANSQYNAALGASNAQNAQMGGLTSGLFSLGAAALGGPAGPAIAGMFSDRRLKKNIKKVGKLDNGLNVYSYEYVWGGPTQIGVMAQEVEKVNPAAVGERAGYKVVDYAAI